MFDNFYGSISILKTDISNLMYQNQFYVHSIMGNTEDTNNYKDIDVLS